MYRGRLWTMRQYAGFGTAEESNRRYRYLLEQGQTGLSVAFDLPTQMGRDPDHPLAHGEVGRVGVAISSLTDMETLLADLPLDKISTSMTINATASILLALYLVVAEKQGVSWDKLNGTIQNDILKEYVARGTYIYPPRPSMRIITDIFEFATKEVPNWNTISISGYHIREAGSTAAQELAFTLADGIAYVDAALKSGLDVDAFAARLSFFFNVHNNFFEEIAKFRAARRLWARIMKERFKARDPRSMMLRFHAQTAGMTLTAQQVENNVVRVAVQALAAVMGGAQSLHTNSKDEALALPTETSARLALRTQQVIAYESEAADTIDPMAGSYYVESLTRELEGAGARIPGANRRPGRRGGGDRARLHAARDSERRLQLSARDRNQTAHHRRRQPVYQHRDRAHRSAEGQSGTGREAKAARRAGARRAQRRGGPGSGRAGSAGGLRRVKPDAADYRSRPPPRHAGRNRRRDAARLRRASPQPRVLAGCGNRAITDSTADRRHDLGHPQTGVVARCC